MGNSTITLQAIVNAVASMPDLNPQANPGSYATDTLLAAATDVMNDIISRRFNFKWNSSVAPTFLTNSWQQDYPLAGLTNVGWLEEAWWVDINSTARPIPMDGINVRRDLPPQSGRWSSQPSEICWLYNNQLQLGVWPGPGVTFAPLLTKGVVTQNPTQSMQDANGNILSLMQPGTTGRIAPAAPAGSAEGLTVPDGTAVWVVCAPTSQGFRVCPLPPGAGPVYQVHSTYQQKAIPFTSLAQTLGNLPDDYSHRFRNGYRIACHKYASDPRLRDRYEPMRGEWIADMADNERQGDREADAYRLLPATRVMEPRRGFRDPRDPSRPY